MSIDLETSMKIFSSSLTPTKEKKKKFQTLEMFNSHHAFHSHGQARKQIAVLVVS